MKQEEVISNNILKYLKINKMTQKDFSIKIGIAPSTLNDYIKLRAIPSHGVIQKMADAFNIGKSDIDETYKSNLNQLVDEEEKKEEQKLITHYRNVNKNNKIKIINYAEKIVKKESTVSTIKEEKEQYVSIYGKVSAGTGFLLPEYECREEVLYNNGKVPKHDIALQVSGNSMTPLFRDNEIIFIKTQQDIENGQIGIVFINSESFVKKIYKSDGLLKLVSLNKEFNDIIPCHKDDIKIFGKVII